MSSTQASGAIRIGATARSASRRSRSCSSSKTAAYIGASPRARNSSNRRRARSASLAVTNSLKVASGQTTVPTSRPASTAPRRPRREAALERQQRRAHVRHGRDDARHPARHPRRAAGWARRPPAPAPAPPARRAAASPDPGRDRASPAPRRGRAARYPGTRGRNAAASRRASVLLPEAAGPSTAMTRGRRQARRLRPARSARPARSSARRSPGSWSRSPRHPSTGHRCGREPAQDQEAHRDPMVELGVDRACRPPAGRRHARSDRRPRPRPRRRRRRARRPSAASRSLSLTRSSASPRITVVPRREGGRHRQDRILVDHASARALGRHVDAASAPRPGSTRSPTGSPPAAALVLDRDRRRPSRAGVV